MGDEWKSHESDLGIVFEIYHTHFKTIDMKKIIAAIGIVALVAGNGFAQNRMAKKEAISGQEVGMKKERQRGMEESLPDLTEAQKTEIQKIKAEHRKNSETQHKEVRELRNKLA